MLRLQVVTGSQTLLASPEGPDLLLSCVLPSAFTVAQGKQSENHHQPLPGATLRSFSPWVARSSKQLPS